MDDAERLELLDKLLEDLAEASGSAPIIVEGRRDTKALRALGIDGDIVELNRGLGLVEFCEGLARRHDKVILLTDWDAKGGKLFRSLSDCFKSLGVKVDGEFRSGLARLAKKGAKDVEGVPGFLVWLIERERAGLKTTIEYRQYVAKWREKRLERTAKEGKW
jgi:5S rRNA maturation endonuclease (ribonuclease M5)